MLILDNYYKLFTFVCKGISNQKYQVYREGDYGVP